MTATPPEPHVPAQGYPAQGYPVPDFQALPFPVQPDMGLAAGQPGPPHTRQRLVSRLPVWQVVISLIRPVLWTGAAVIILVGGVLELTIDNVPGAVVCVIVGALAVWFAYRACKRWVRRFLT